MKQIALASVGFMLLFFCAAFTMAAADLQVIPVSEKLFLFSASRGGNVAFLVTDEGALVVDSGLMAEQSRQMLAKIRTLTEKPIRYIVLTHYHGDHINGLSGFPAEAVIIAHQNVARDIRELVVPENRQMLEKEYPAQIAATRQSIEKLKKHKGKKAELAKEKEKLRRLSGELQYYQNLRIVYPYIGYEQKLSIALGGETIEVIHPGPAHTNCDSLVFFPGQRAVHMGDLLFNNMVPYIDWQAGSNTANWIAKLNEVQGWPVDKVIPGHGQLAGKEALKMQAAFLVDLRQEVQQAIDQGKTLEEMKKTVHRPEWLPMDDATMLPIPIEAVYHELKNR